MGFVNSKEFKTMSQRCTKKDIQNIAETRNHLLVSMEGYKNIKSQIVLYCNECQRTFKTTLHSYKNAKRTGCPNCKKMSVSKHYKNKFVSSITRKKIGQANRNKPGSLKGRTGAEHPRWKGGYQVPMLICGGKPFLNGIITNVF